MKYFTNTLRIILQKLLFFGSRFLRYLIYSVVTGIIVGLVGSAFHHCMSAATMLRQTYTWLIYLLPAGGLLIIGNNYLLRDKSPQGTSLVLNAIHNQENVPIKTAPLIFIDTVLTHLFGGSAGREGAALQLGGSLGGFIATCSRADKTNRKILILCGMSAAFSALFGTPIAASVFVLEVVNVGVLYYTALVPCVLSAVIAFLVARALNVAPEVFSLSGVPELSALVSGKVIIFAFLCALVSILFCKLLQLAKHTLTKYFRNPFLRIFAGGLIVVALTLLIQSRDYLGTGMSVIGRCINDGYVPVAPAFLLKIVFTAITLGAGFCGGEIVPSFFIGAAFGATVGGLFGFEPSFAAAVGMLCVFCGVTNCPIASLLIGFELFGYSGAILFFIAIAVSYLASGSVSLYSTQKIADPKFGAEFEKRNPGDD